MSWTKRQFMTAAFEEIGLAAYVYDLTPEQMQSAVKRMDAMIAGWNSNGVRIVSVGRFPIEHEYRRRHRRA